MKTVERNVGPNQVRLIGYLYDTSGEIPGRKKRPCVIVCPGGGYAYRSDREADPVAFQFLAAGYHVFLLEYTTAGRDGAGAPLGMNPLIELSEAVSLVRGCADEWGIDREAVAVCGFSAGGHVAASLGVHWNSERLRAAGADGSNRPDAMVLCYPVIIAGEKHTSHGGSAQNLTGGAEEDLRFFNLYRHVSEETSPAFLWHTVTDGSVPLENSLYFAAALREHQIPMECHFYAEGGHGMSLCTKDVNTPDRHNASWLPLCIEWLDSRFGVERF